MEQMNKQRNGEREWQIGKEKRIAKRSKNEITPAEIKNNSCRRVGASVFTKLRLQNWIEVCFPKIAFARRI